MGMPMRDEASQGEGARGAHSVDSHSEGLGSGPHSVFEYGNLRPDVSPINSAGVVSTKAWLMGSRLYSFNRGGEHQAAVRLEEPGYAVLGYMLTAPQGNGIASLLQESERRQYSTQLYERDVVEVITEGGQQHECYVYHRPDVTSSNPVPTGDWCSRSTS